MYKRWQILYVPPEWKRLNELEQKPDEPFTEGWPNRGSGVGLREACAQSPQQPYFLTLLTPTLAPSWHISPFPSLPPSPSLCKAPVLTPNRPSATPPTPHLDPQPIASEGLYAGFLPCNSWDRNGNTITWTIWFTSIILFIMILIWTCNDLHPNLDLDIDVYLWWENLTSITSESFWICGGIQSDSFSFSISPVLRGPNKSDAILTTFTQGDWVPSEDPKVIR